MVLLLRKTNISSALRYRFRLTSAFHVSHSNFEKRKVIKSFLLADIGEGITECEILKWSVQPPSTIQPFDTLCEVQSDKASVELTSPFEGVLKKLLVQEGEVAKVGQGLCEIEVEEEVEEGSEATTSPPSPADATTPHTTAQAAETIPSPSPPPRQRRPHPLDPSFPPTSLATLRHSHPHENTSVVFKSGAQADVLASPAVRHLARKVGILPLSALAPGSGKDGRIERKDIDAFIKRQNKEDGATIPQPYTSPVGKGEDVVLELGRTRRAMWKAMTKSLEIPHFGYSTSLDVTEISKILPLLSLSIPSQFNPLPLRKSTSVSPSSIFRGTSADPGIEPQSDQDELGKYTRVTMLPFLLKTLSKAMIEWPVFRSSITPTSASTDKPTLTLRPASDISIALATPTGLYTPTIPSVQSLSVYEIAARIKRLQTLGERVPSGLTPTDMPKRGGTISVSNVGAVGKGEDAFPRLVEGGGVAIVAIGRARWEVRVLDDEGNLSSARTDSSGRLNLENDNGLNLENRLVLPISWSADHRVVEGAELAAFVESWRAWVERPARLIGEGR